MMRYVIMLALVLLPGCETTRNMDGTETYRLDRVVLRTAWEAFEMLQARRARLQEEEKAADKRRAAEIRRELAAIEPEYRELLKQLGLTY